MAIAISRFAGQPHGVPMSVSTHDAREPWVEHDANHAHDQPEHGIDRPDRENGADDRAEEHDR